MAPYRRMNGILFGVKSVVCGFIAVATVGWQGVSARTSATSGAAPSEIRWG